MTDCLGIPEISFDDLAVRLYDASQRFPIAGALELTERCNLRCVHCYVRRPAGDLEAKSRELSYGQWASILDELADMGCLKLLLTGGEVLLHPDFADIYIHARKKGLVVTVFTNGTLLNERWADLFAEWPPFLLSISLYGASEETYARMTGVAGLYARLLHNIDLLRERDVLLDLKAVLTTVNHHEYQAMKEYVTGLGLEMRHDAIMWPGVEGVEPTCALRLAPKVIAELDFGDEERAQLWLEQNQGQLAASNSGYIYSCGAGLRGFYVNAQGRIGLCVMSRATEYSVVEGSFREGWETVLPQVRFQETTRDWACVHCDIAALCVNCPAFAEWENGDPETVVPYLCQVAQARAEKLGLDLAPGAWVVNSHEGVR